MIFELLFLLLAFATLAALVVLLVAIIRNRRSTARRISFALPAIWAAYLCIVFGVAATRPQRIIPRAQDRCFDEMCFAPVHVDTAAQLGTVRASGTFYVVTIRVRSRSRGRAQSERGVYPLLWDSGRTFSVSAEGQRAWESLHARTPPLSTRLAPGESVESVQVFDLPADVTAPGLVLSHGFTPGYLVIGECPLFHPPTIQQLIR